MDRRRFLKTSLAATAGSVVLGSLAFPAKVSGGSPRKILVLGGTSFLGPISSQKAFDAGWTQRPFTETALDCLWFFDQLDPGVWEWTDELSPQAEAKTLAAWQEAKTRWKAG